MLTRELVSFHRQDFWAFKVSRLMGGVFLFVYTGEGLMLCHDSLPWIKFGTLIWVKIMEFYMSLSMSAFHKSPKWKVTTGCRWRGRQGCQNGNWVTTRLSLRLTCNQTAADLTVIQHQPDKHYILLLSSHLCALFTCLFGYMHAKRHLCDYDISV